MHPRFLTMLRVRPTITMTAFRRNGSFAGHVYKNLGGKKGEGFCSKGAYNRKLTVVANDYIKDDLHW